MHQEVLTEFKMRDVVAREGLNLCSFVQRNVVLGNEKCISVFVLFSCIMRLLDSSGWFSLRLSYMIISMKAVSQSMIKNY